MSILAAHAHDVSAFGFWEWLAVGTAGLLCVWVIWKAVVLTFNPREDDPHHIKRMILDDDRPPAGEEPAPSRPGGGGSLKSRT